MSHGDAYGNLQSSDEEKISIKHDIEAAFDGLNWPIMQGKPKIFFIQGCRGIAFCSKIPRYCSVLKHWESSA